MGRLSVPGSSEAAGASAGKGGPVSDSPAAAPASPALVPGKPVVGMTRWMQAIRGKMADHPQVVKLQAWSGRLAVAGALAGIALAAIFLQAGFSGSRLAAAVVIALSLPALAWVMTICGLLALAPKEFLTGEAGEAWVKRLAAGRPLGPARVLLALEAVLAAILSGAVAAGVLLRL
ncbi:MAG: hypothetical protein GX442_07455 [Candidatus Riflebacteria bacterium]|nr:hypothetical protein [Candidatus Riflebacteria bacterium]